MVEPNSPGLGRSTSEAAITELKKEIARRYERGAEGGRQEARIAREGASREPTEVESARNLPEQP